MVMRVEKEKRTMMRRRMPMQKPTRRKKRVMSSIPLGRPHERGTMTGTMAQKERQKKSAEAS
jgi:hypothetical protein